MGPPIEIGIAARGRSKVSGVVDAIIAAAAVLLLIAGFWWTRGAGGLPGGTDDPARQELRKYDELGDRLPEPGDDPD